jgi:hypothetical protein
MGAALRPSQLPPAAKTLPITDSHVSRVISKRRKEWRDRSREVLLPAFEGARAVPSDLAEALVIAERCARRALQLKDAAPFDHGDLLAFADHSPANLRTALRMHDAIGAELARIALKFHR